MRPGQGVCDDCHETILRLFTIGGRLIDLDPEPHDDGNRTIVTVAGDIRARTLTGTDLPAPAGTAHKVHWCPAKGPTGPPCANPRCDLPLPREIGGKPCLWTYHPACEPEFTDQLLEEQRARVRRQFKPRRRRK